MKKFLTTTLLLIILLNSFYTCFAIEKDPVLVKHKKDCDLYLKYNGKFKSVHYAVFEKNGKEYPAYCLNPEFGGVNTHENGQYIVDVTGKISNEKVWKVIINGYPYKTLEELGVINEEEAYTATQFAIYTVLENRNIEDYTADTSEAGNRTLNAYLKIMDAVKVTEQSMNGKISIIPNTDNWEIDENKIDYLNKIYNFDSNISNGTYTVSLKGEDIDKLIITDINGIEKRTFNIGENFKILAPINILNRNIEFQIEAEANVITNPILHGKSSISGMQDYALTGETVENLKTIYKDNIPKNTSQITIIKQELGTAKRLEGVKFSLLNSSKDIVIQNLITNGNGEIILENMLPGSYYLQEVETLENYELNSELIEINLELNQEIEIIVDNKLKMVFKEEIEKKEENVDVKVEEKENEKLEAKEENKINEAIKDASINIETKKTLPVTGY